MVFFGKDLSKYVPCIANHVLPFKYRDRNLGISNSIFLQDASSSFWSVTLNTKQCWRISAELKMYILSRPGRSRGLLYTPSLLIRFFHEFIQTA